MRKPRSTVVLAITLLCFGLIGNANARPSFGGNCAGCHIAPTVTNFSLPASHDALTVPIQAFSASDTDPQRSSLARVTGYLLTTSPQMPAGNEPGWSSSPPSQYVFAADGLNTLYAWAMDAVGNISAGVGATVDISMNIPPVADAGPVQNVKENMVVTLDGSNSHDDDDGIKTFLWEQIGGFPVTIVDADMETASFVSPDVSVNGESLTFQLTVTDYSGAVSTDTCIVNVSWVNEPPTADAGVDQEVAMGTEVALDGSGSSDPDGGTLSYLWEQTQGVPVVLSDPTAARPTFTLNDVGTNGESLTFQLTVTDNGQLMDIDTCVVNITFVNTPPKANAGPDQDAMAGDEIALDGSASFDPDGGALQYVWTQTTGTPVTLSDPGAAQPMFTAVAPAGGSDTLSFLLTVTDQGGLQATDTCVVRVADNTPPPAPQNQAPVADAGADQTMEQGTTVSLDGSGSSDPDGDTLIYLWTQTAGTPVVLSDPAAVNPTFVAPTTGTQEDLIQFSLTVSDPAGLWASDVCAVSIPAVQPPSDPPTNNDPPTYDPPPAGDDDGSGSYDDDHGDDDHDGGDDHRRGERQKRSHRSWRRWYRWARSLW